MTAAPEPFYELWAALMAGYDETRLLVARPAWHTQAACRGVGPGRVYVAQGEDTRPARALCAQCPVSTPCAAAGDDHGIWGRDERTPAPPRSSGADCGTLRVGAARR